MRKNPPEGATKVCSKCSIEKPIDKFDKDYRSPGKHTAQCRDCTAIYLRGWRKNPKNYAASKICRMCHIEKSKSEFPISQSNTDGLRTYCKECTQKRNLARRSRINDTPKVIPEKSVCNKCHREKLRICFSKDRGSVNGLFATCKECRSIYHDELRLKLEPIRIPIESKQCPKCKEIKPASEFSPSREHKSGLLGCCKVCKSKARLSRRYKISIGEYDQMIDRQSNRCAICGNPETVINERILTRLSIDHDHTSGKVRALLCRRCNIALGTVSDDISLLRKMIAYLESFNPPAHAALSRSMVDDVAPHLLPGLADDVNCQKR